MPESKQMYANVIVPLALQGTFTYSVPQAMQSSLRTGCRVLVQFGRKKTYTAIVVALHFTKPEGYDVKEILAMLDDKPIIRHPQLDLWQWIADYYLCTIGEVYKAAVPSGLKVESETFISINPEYEETEDDRLNDRERVIMDFAAQRGRVQLDEISRSTGFKNVVSIVSRMLEREAIHIAERVVDNYRPKTETCVTLAIEHGDEAALHTLFDKVARAKKQETLLLAFLDLSHWLQRPQPAEVTKDALLKRAGVTQPVLRAAIDKGVFALYKKPVNRFDMVGKCHADAPVLTDEQQRAYTEIHQSFTSHNITLLHGVTSSGKTSIYIHLIQDALAKGKQALYLVPEIALTTQLTQRLQKVLGEQLLIYHSRFSDNERVDIWRRLLDSNEPMVVIGVRSAVFLPFSNLGLVIVDEEHDSSYKQQDPAPRYNGRDIATVLASMHGAKTLFGSATPAIDTYYKALNGRFGLVKLLTRYEGIELPRVHVIDTKLARKKHEMNGLFSQELVSKCRQALDRGEQLILFQNRRGYSPMVRCRECAWTPKCTNCDVTLTYHKRLSALTCHYCGYTLTLPSICPVCEQPAIEVVGYGTERIEDDIEKVFPEGKIARMDLDTTRSKTSYERIINEFSEHKSNILVGTQMVTKGLDFDGVSIVGILNADTMISFPDFRSHERAFNMMEQVAGRAGRKHAQGLVVMQTSDPEHPVVKLVQQHDYLGFYNLEIAERQRYAYPPFTRIVNIYMKHRNEDVLTEMSAMISQMLRQVFGTRILGPEAPMVARVQQLFIKQIVLKIEVAASMTKVKDFLRKIYADFVARDSRAKGCIIYYDVDPM